MVEKNEQDKRRCLFRINSSEFSLKRRFFVSNLQGKLLLPTSFSTFAPQKILPKKFHYYYEFISRLSQRN